MLSGKRPFALLLGFTVLVAAAVAVADPLSFPMPGYRDGIREWAAHGYIGDTFTPLAYPLFGGLGYKLGGNGGLLAVQALLHVAIAATAYALLRRLRLPPVWSAAGALPLVLHPDLLTSVAKTWDVALSTELYLLVALALLVVLNPGQKTAQVAEAERPCTRTVSLSRLLVSALLAGLALGAGMSSRPNFLLLTPVLLWAAFRRDGPGRNAELPRRFAAALLLCAAAALAFFALGAAEHGRAYFPRNGPYNLYAGHNAFTAHALLTAENAEPSIVPAYAATPNLPDPGDYYGARLQTFYTRGAEAFALHHPLAEACLIGIKAFTLFRPDTKVHSLLSVAGLAKGLLALPAALLAAALFWPGRRPSLSTADRALLWLDALYVLPFLITNADPRFRTPLDALLILQCVRLLWIRRRSRGYGESLAVG